MAFMKTVLVSSLLLYSQDAYSPSPADYQPSIPQNVSGGVLWETRSEIPGHGFKVSQLRGNYFFYSTGKDSDIIRELVEARGSVEVEFEKRDVLFGRVVKIDLDNIVAVNHKKLK